MGRSERSAGRSFHSRRHSGPPASGGSRHRHGGCAGCLRRCRRTLWAMPHARTPERKPAPGAADRAGNQLVHHRRATRRLVTALTAGHKQDIGPLISQKSLHWQGQTTGPPRLPCVCSNCNRNCSCIRAIHSALRACASSPGVPGTRRSPEAANILGNQQLRAACQEGHHIVQRTIVVRVDGRLPMRPAPARHRAPPWLPSRPAAAKRLKEVSIGQQHHGGRLSRHRRAPRPKAFSAGCASGGSAANGHDV